MISDIRSDQKEKLKKSSRASRQAEGSLLNCLPYREPVIRWEKNPWEPLSLNYKTSDKVGKKFVGTPLS